MLCYDCYILKEAYILSYHFVNQPFNNFNMCLKQKKTCKGLRQQPAMDLRKTCKLLKQFLPTDIQSEFQGSYEIMIDAVNDMDVVRLFFMS
jgi:hypothetical protein